MTTVISFVSAKGGSGKTVLGLSIANFLSHVGLRVVVVDADAATNGATLFLLDDVLKWRAQGDDVGEGLFEVPGRREVPMQVETGYGFDFVPASFTMSDTASASERVDVAAVIGRAVDSLRHGGYDVIIIDNQAGTERTAVASSTLSDVVVIVSDFDPVSTQGVHRLQRLHGDALPDARTWVLYNKVLPEFASSISDRLLVARLLPPMPWSAQVVRAYAIGELPVRYDPPTEYVLGLANLLEVLLQGAAREAIRTWRQSSVQGLERALSEQKSQLLVELDRAAKRESRIAVGEVVRYVVRLLAGLGVVLVVLVNDVPLAVSIASFLAVVVMFMSDDLGRESMTRAEYARQRDAIEERLSELDMVLRSPANETSRQARLLNALEQRDTGGYNASADSV